MMRRMLIAAIAVLAITVVTLAYFAKPLKIAYHRRALDQLQVTMYATPTTVSDQLVGYGGNGELEQQEHHLNQLVILGAFFHRQYEMKHLPDTDEVHKAFWLLVLKEFPDSPYPTLGYPSNVLEVWDIAETRPEWDAFARKYNVADFESKFVAKTKDEAKENDR